MIRVMRACALLLTFVAPMGPILLVHCGGRSVLIELAPSSEPEPEPAPNAEAGPSTDTGVDTDAPSRRETGPTKEAAAICPPASTVNAGALCSAAGLKCPSNTLNYDCNGQPTTIVSCTCGQRMWNCTYVMPVCPVPPTCPPPSAIQPGGSCSVGPALTCKSASQVDLGCGVVGNEVCQCDKGQWFCQIPPGPVCVDASMPPDAMPPETCPDPSALVEGTPCTSSGLTCKGNPTVCGGATFYDAFQCDGSKFVTIAGTVCGIDGGEDSSTD